MTHDYIATDMAYSSAFKDGQRDVLDGQREGKPSCTTCPFWDRQEPNEWQSSKGLAYGLCRHRPPGLESQGVTTWPQTQHHDWCGEHPAFTTVIVDGGQADLTMAERAQGSECQHRNTHLSAARYGTRVCSDCGAIL